MFNSSKTKYFCSRLASTSVTKAKKKVNCAVYGCGLSASGALAIPKLVHGNNNSETELNISSKEIKFPKRIPFFNTEKIKHVSSGFGFSLFASKDKLYGAGINNQFQISGHIHDISKFKGQEYYISAKKIAVKGDILEISSGRAHSLILTTEGVYAIGQNNFGQCGIDPNISEVSVAIGKNSLKPIEIESDHPIVSIHCSLDTSFVINSIGEVFAFGLGEDGQCSNEKYDIQWKPQKIRGDSEGHRIIKVRGSTDTLMALSENGEVFIWGQTEYGQASEATSEIQLNVSRKICLSRSIGSVKGVDSTSTSCIIVNEEGSVFTWGVGAIGFGPTLEKIDRPTRMDQPLFDNSKVEAVFAGNSAMAAINEKGRLFMWGENRFGLLGLGHLNRQMFPYQIFIPGDVQNISLGPDHSLIHVKMSVVRAAGLVVYRKLSAEKIEYLLLQASYPPHHWTPPKGHVDPGEDEWMAAIRETQEEANLTKEQLVIYEDCHETLRYMVKGRPKSVKYWLALLKNPDDVKLSHEHQNWKWCELEEAIKVSEYPEMAKLFRNFAEYISKH